MPVELVTFPARSKIKATVKKEGFVGRAALCGGKRKPFLGIEGFQKGQIEIGFGYIAGKIVHINTGLNHCVQVNLFDLKKGIGTSSHLQIISGEASFEKEESSLKDFEAEVVSMIETLKILGANSPRLTGTCIFGMETAYPAPAQDILSILYYSGISLPVIFGCRDADIAYRTYLDRGLITYIDENHGPSTRLVKFTRDMPDLAPRMLTRIEEAKACFKSLCGSDGEQEFLNFLLPRFTVRYFKRPDTFIKKIRAAIDECSYSSRSLIGRSFKEHPVPR